MKTKKLSQFIFESVGDIRGYPDLDLVTIDQIKEWLTQKQTNPKILPITEEDWRYVVIDNFIDELLEELSHAE